MNYEVKKTETENMGKKFEAKEITYKGKVYVATKLKEDYISIISPRYCNTSANSFENDIIINAIDKEIGKKEFLMEARSKKEYLLSKVKKVKVLKTKGGYSPDENPNITDMLSDERGTELVEKYDLSDLSETEIKMFKLLTSKNEL